MSAKLREVPTANSEERAALRVAPLMCRLDWHKWSVWGEPFEVASLLASFKLRHQRSECVRCGAIKERSV
jgi:hypothetical protein